MPTFNFPFEPPAQPDTTTPPPNDTGPLGRLAHLGFGLLQPLRRDQQGDFAAGGGEELVRACVGQVLGTVCSTDDGGTQGELPWRPEFGSVLTRLRHKQGDATTQQLARTYVVQALARWEPRVRVKAAAVSVEDRNVGAVKGKALVIRLRYDIIAANAPGNAVVLPNVQQTLELPVNT